MTTLFSKTIDFDQPFQRLRLRSFRPFWTISHSENSEIGHLTFLDEMLLKFCIPGPTLT